MTISMFCPSLNLPAFLIPPMWLQRSAKSNSLYRNWLAKNGYTKAYGDYIEEYNKAKEEASQAAATLAAMNAKDNYSSASNRNPFILIQRMLAQGITPTLALYNIASAPYLYAPNLTQEQFALVLAAITDSSVRASFASSLSVVMKATDNLSTCIQVPGAFVITTPSGSVKVPTTGTPSLISSGGRPQGGSLWPDGSLRHFSSSAAQARDMVKSSLGEFFKGMTAVDNGGPTSNLYHLANRIIASGAPVTLEDVNTLIKDYPLLTQSAMDFAKSAEWSYFDLPLTEEESKRLTSVAGSTESKSPSRKSGIYCFVDKETNKVLYIGSSITLGARVRSYINPGKQHIIKGPMGIFVRNSGLDTIKLGVIPLEGELTNLYVAIEQYLILTMNPSLNVNKVAGSGGVTLLSKEALDKQIALRGAVTYVYSGDRTKLLHDFPSMRNADSLLGFSAGSVARGVAENRTVKGLFFSDKLLDDAISAPMSISDLCSLVNTEQHSLPNSAKTRQYFVTYEGSDTVLTFDHFQNVKQFITAVGLDRTLMKSVTSPLTGQHPAKTIEGLGIQLEDSGNPLGTVLYPNAIPFDPSSYSSTHMSKLLPLLKPVVFKRRQYNKSGK